MDPSALSEAFGEVPYALRRQKEVTIKTEPTTEVEAQKQLKSLLNETQEVLAEYELVLAIIKNETLKRVKPPKSKSSSSSAIKKGRKTFSKSKDSRKLSSSRKAAVPPSSLLNDTPKGN